MSGGNRSTPGQQTATAVGVSHAVGFGSETGSTAHSEGGSVARLAGDVKVAVKTPQSVLDAMCDAETLLRFTASAEEAATYGEAAVRHMLGLDPFGYPESPVAYSRAAAHAAFTAVPALRYPDLSPIEQGISDFYEDRTRVEKGD